MDSARPQATNDIWKRNPGERHVEIIVDSGNADYVNIWRKVEVSGQHGARWSRVLVAYTPPGTTQHKSSDSMVANIDGRCSFLADCHKIANKYSPAVSSRCSPSLTSRASIFELLFYCKHVTNKRSRFAEFSIDAAYAMA